MTAEPHAHAVSPAPLDRTTLERLRVVLDVAGLARGDRELDDVLDALATTIADGLGWRTVAINLYRPAWDDFQVVTVHGSEDARNALLGVTTDWGQWRPLLAKRFHRCGAYLVDHREIDWAREEIPIYIPELEKGTAANAWDPEDGLIVPLAHSDGHLLGILSVDEPHSGLRPNDEEIDLICAVAGEVARAVEHVQRQTELGRYRAALEHLHEVSARLSFAAAPEAVLDAIAQGISSALDFHRVGVFLRQDDGFAPTALAGWPADEPPLQPKLSKADFHRVVDKRFEVEGCYLLPHADASELCTAGSDYASRMNGLGPWAWNRHWLLAPLYRENGERIGFIWADDPDDRLLPSPEKLRVLRMFANHASTALELARTFAAEHDASRELERRKQELETLHDTTLDVVEHLDRGHAIESIVARACELLGTEHGFVYLVEDADEELVFALGTGAFSDCVGVRLARGEGIAGRVWESGQALLVDSYKDWNERAEPFEGFGFRAVLGVPLRSKDRFIGILGIGHRDGKTFDADDVALIEQFGRLASLGLENARLFDEVWQSQELYRRVLETSTDVMTLFHLDGTVASTSAAVESVFGWTPEELVGQNFVDLVHPDDLAAANVSIAAALTDGSSSPSVARIKHKDGHWVHAEGKPAVIRNERGEPEMILGISRDVSDRMEGEDRRRELEAQLRQSQKMEAVGSLAGGIAHDFNNLLTAIAGYGGLALAAVPEGRDELKSDVQEMLNAAERARQLIRQLLAFSRKQVLQPRVLDLNETVTGMQSILHRLIGEDVELVTKLQADLGHTNADPGQLEQVLLNLCINARDAMPEGGRLVVETFDAELDDEFLATHVGARVGPCVALRVSDTGHGMSAEVQSRVFEPFFTTKDERGTGLGLSTVYGIVKQSDGYIWCDSEPGNGTTFTVYLPRHDAEAPRIVEAPGPATSANGTETVLLAEDEELVRCLVHQLLERLGYSVLVASNGVEALERLEEHQGHIDLLLTDLVMPGMNGRELAAIVRERFPAARVLFMSGYNDEAVTSHGVLQPSAQLLEKPFTASSLGSKVRAVLDGPSI